MRKANLRFRNGLVVAVLVRKPAVEDSGSPRVRLDEWPHALKYRQPRRQFMPLTPMRRAEDMAPSKTTGEIIETEFHIDRALFDPDRHWQNYIETE